MDFVNLMTYDFRVAEGDPISGHHANLFPSPADAEQRSVDRAVKEFLAAGVPPSKLVVGVPFYGRGWSGVAADRNGRYQPGKPIEPRMDLNYSHLASDVIGRDGFERFWDTEAQAPYLWNAEPADLHHLRGSRIARPQDPATSASTASPARCSGSTTRIFRARCSTPCIEDWEDARAVFNPCGVQWVSGFIVRRGVRRQPDCRPPETVHFALGTAYFYAL